METQESCLCPRPSIKTSVGFSEKVVGTNPRYSTKKCRKFSGLMILGGNICTRDHSHLVWVEVVESRVEISFRFSS